MIHAVRSVDGENVDRHPCFRRFAGIDRVSDRIPDETTILKFCHLLEEHGNGEQILEAVKQTLKDHGALLQEGPSSMSDHPRY